MADLMISDNNMFSFTANVTKNNSPKHPLTILQGERCFRKFAFYYVALHLADSQNMYAELFSHMAENTQVSQKKLLPINQLLYMLQKHSQIEIQARSFWIFTILPPKKSHFTDIFCFYFHYGKLKISK